MYENDSKRYINNNRWKYKILYSRNNRKNKIVQLAYGKVDDIKFPLVPYGKYEVQHISVDENYLYICIDDNINFAQINPELTDITCDGFTGYII